MDIRVGLLSLWARLCAEPLYYIGGADPLPQPLTAEEEARLTQLRAQEGIRHEIAGVSAELAEKLLGREINEQDHRSLIDAFIDEMEDSRGADQ